MQWNFFLSLDCITALIVQLFQKLLIILAQLVLQTQIPA